MDTPELTITVDYTAKGEDGKEVPGTFTVAVSRDAEKLAAAEKAKEKGKDAKEVTGYVRVGESQIVYEISEYKCKNLLAASYNDLRHREVLTADFEDICQVDISLEGSNYTFVADDKDEDDERIWKYGEEEIEIDAFKKELYSLSANSSEAFLSEKPGGKKEISLTLYLDKENDPEIIIELYRWDGEDCLAVLDGQTFALIKRADVVDLIEAVNAIVLN